jgi:hypothetical protein
VGQIEEVKKLGRFFPAQIHDVRVNAGYGIPHQVLLTDAFDLRVPDAPGLQPAQVTLPQNRTLGEDYTAVLIQQVPAQHHAGLELIDVQQAQVRPPFFPTALNRIGMTLSMSYT